MFLIRFFISTKVILPQIRFTTCSFIYLYWEARVQVPVETINLLNGYLSLHLPSAQLKSVSFYRIFQFYLPLGRNPGLFQSVKTGLLLPKAGLVFGGLVVFVPGIQGSSGLQQDFQSGQSTVTNPKKVYAGMRSASHSR